MQSIIATITLIALIPLNLYAAEQPETKQQLNIQTLTLEGAITFALEHSPKIKGAQITVALAELDLKQTRFWNWFVPSLTLHQGYDPALAESRLGIGISFDINKILGGGHKQGKQAKLKLFNSEIYLTNIKQVVIASVTQRYYDYIIAQKNIQILEEQLQNSVKLQEILKLKFESAQAQISQLLSAAESIATTKLALLKAQAEVKLTFLKLKQEIGLQ